jgi:hypothetical protein
LKRGLTTSWLLASALALALGTGLAPAQSRNPDAPTNEVTLAGLRPGRDTLAAAEKRFGTKNRDTQIETDDIKQWGEYCTGRTLRLEVDESGVIQSVTVSSFGRRGPECTDKEPPGSPLRVENLKTGRGLMLGQLRKRVVALYGEPDSVVPATFEGGDFELLYYAFDWAGSDVPQVMEVTCERGSGRVRKVTLAFPSL